jgi:C1A family cysteine protease
LNHLSDWTPEEFAQLNGFRRDPDEDRQRHEEADTDPFVQSILNDTTPLPAQVDWRQVPNRVSAVKDQSSCGSCWAFASTGVLEGQQVSANKTGSLIPLSEQNLMDCSRKNNACYGGNMYDAFEDVAAMGGIERANTTIRMWPLTTSANSTGPDLSWM